MGIVMDKYWQMVEENKDIVPDDIYEYLLCSAFNLNLKPTKVEKERFFVYGNKELSQAVYNFLCFNIKPYMYMYASEYGINILLRGFEDSSDLIYFAKWLVEKFFNYNSTKIIDYNILRTRDKKLSKEKILFKIVKCTLLKNQFYNIDNSGKDEFWAFRKMELIDLINQNKTFAYELLNEYMHYKQMDDILLALNNTTVKY